MWSVKWDAYSACWVWMRASRLLNELDWWKKTYGYTCTYWKGLRLLLSYLSRIRETSSDEGSGGSYLYSNGRWARAKNNTVLYIYIKFSYYYYYSQISILSIDAYKVDFLYRKKNAHTNVYPLSCFIFGDSFLSSQASISV